MKTQFLSFLVFIIVSQNAISQSDTLNRLDANNKKTGWWIVYLDKDLATAKDSSKAIYYKYSYFQGKYDHYDISRIGTKSNPVIPYKEIKAVNGAIPLDGTYKANFSNGKTRFILTARNGRLIEYSEFYKTGNLKHTFKYNELCGDTFLQYCIYLYKKDGSLKAKTWPRKVKG